MLLAIGTATGLFRRIVVHVWVRRGAGILILLFGVYTLAGLGGHAGHDSDHGGAAPAASHSNHVTR
jgi:hypothetical protein